MTYKQPEIPMTLKKVMELETYLTQVGINKRTALTVSHGNKKTVPVLMQPEHAAVRVHVAVQVQVQVHAAVKLHLQLEHPLLARQHLLVIPGTSHTLRMLYRSRYLTIRALKVTNNNALMLLFNVLRKYHHPKSVVKNSVMMPPFNVLQIQHYQETVFNDSVTIQLFNAQGSQEVSFNKINVLLPQFNGAPHHQDIVIIAISVK